MYDRCSGRGESVGRVHGRLRRAAHEPLVWTLAQGQVEVFRIRVRSSRPALYSWRARIPVIVHGERYFIAVDDDGSALTFAGGGIHGFRTWDGVSSTDSTG